MKHIFMFLLCGVSLSLLSQPSFKLYFAHTSNEVAPNTTLQITSMPLYEIKVTLDILNTSSVQTHVYDVKRYDIIVHSNGNDDAALPYFCFGSLCYPNIALFSTQSLTLNPGQNSKSVGSGPDSAYFSLNIDLLEATERGLSEIKYTIFNTLNPNDSVQVTARYNDPSLVGIANNNAVKNTLHVLPNPAQTEVRLVLQVPVAQEGHITLVNALGQAVFSQSVQLLVGENNLVLPVEHFARGLYSLSVEGGISRYQQKLMLH